MSDEEGDEMQTDTCILIEDDLKVIDASSKLTAERRSVNSDRRINNGHDYKGPARRMNLDRRK